MADNSAAILQAMKDDMFAKYVMDSSKLIETIQHFLKGEELKHEKINMDGRDRIVPVWRAIEGAAPISEEGYRYIMRNLYPLLDKLTSSGNVDREDALQDTRRIMDTITEGLVIKHIEFGLKTPNEIDSIIEPILTLIKLHLSKSVNMGFLEKLLSRFNVNEVRSSDADAIQPGMSL